jgi:competence protein ComEC
VLAGTLAAVGILALGLGWAGLHEARIRSSTLRELAPGFVVIRGTLRTDPQPGGFGWSAIVDVSQVRWDEGVATLRSSAWVGGNELPAGELARGDLVRIEGAVAVPDDPGFAEYLRRRALPVEVQARSVTRLGPSPSSFIRAAQAVRRLIGRSIERLFPPREAGLLLGLALGDDSGLEQGLERDFRASGLSHLLVVSGENVVMILAPVLAAASILRLSNVPRFVLGVGTVAFFTVLTGAEPSVMRAAVMATLALIGILMGRSQTTSSILGGAVFLLLVLDPPLAWSVGFQLSVAATAGMVAMASPISDRLKRIMPKPLALASAATISAQLGVTPVLLFYFHQVPGATIAANVLAFPAVSPALLLGIAASTIGLVWTDAGHFVAELALIPMRWLEFVADRLAKAPMGSITSGGGLGVLAAGVIAVTAVAVWLRTRWRPPRVLIAAGVALLPLLVWATALKSGPPAGLVVRFFDVGQGDSALISTPSGANVLIDAGPDQDQVSTYLAGLGIKRLDLVIATHPHADHVAGLPNVLSRIPASVVLEPGCPSDEALSSELRRAISEEGIRVVHPRVGDVFTVGDLRLEVLAPDRCWIGTNSDPNNDSIVVMATLHEDSVLFMGDSEKDAHEVLLESGISLEADVLKVPHHGGDTSLPELFEMTNADIAVVSVGENDYGHPVPEVLREISAAGSEVWRTDRHGTVTITFDEAGVVVTADR